MNSCNKCHCEKCNTFYSDQRALTRHYKTKKHQGTSHKLYRCEACNYDTYDQANWSRHCLTKKHRSGGPTAEADKCTQCPICLTQFKNHHSYRSHMSTHNLTRLGFASEYGALSGKLNKLKKTHAGAKCIVAKSEYEKVDTYKLSDAQEIVNSFPMEEEQLKGKMKRLKDYYESHKDKYVPRGPYSNIATIDELIKKLEHHSKIVDDLDEKMELKNKSLNELSKKDQQQYERNEVIVSQLSKRIVALRKANKDKVNGKRKQRR